MKFGHQLGRMIGLSNLELDSAIKQEMEQLVKEGRELSEKLASHRQYLEL